MEDTRARTPLLDICATAFIGAGLCIINFSTMLANDCYRCLLMAIDRHFLSVSLQSVLGPWGRTMGGHRFQLGVPVAVGTGADQTINPVSIQLKNPTQREWRIPAIVSPC
jgi:hypothetical protein